MNDNEKIEITFLMLDGKPRLTCTDCAKRLHKLDMLRVVDRVHGMTFYEIIEPFTLDDTREAIKDQHR
jgi:hypothetical protein